MLDWTTGIMNRKILPNIIKHYLLTTGITIGKLRNDISFMWHSKILCPLQKHVYIENNYGISLYYLSLCISYHKCSYCNYFKLKHTPRTPQHIINNCLDQKRIYELNTMYRKYVLFEKYDPYGEVCEEVAPEFNLNIEHE